ncbi:MAG: hypothetical protein KGZ64_03330 [Thermaerobacter sp.]|nr:hypothetical protein [Thermaerobacter sp.]
MLKRVTSLVVVAAIVGTAMLASMATVAARPNALPVVITETRLPRTAQLLFNGEELTIRLNIYPTGRSQGTVNSAHSSYQLNLTGKLEPLPTNRAIMVGTLLGTVETTQGIKEVGLHCEIGLGVSVITMTVDGMGRDFIIFGDLAHPARRPIIEHYRRRLGSPNPHLSTVNEPNLHYVVQDSSTDIAALSSFEKIRHREHKGTALFRQLNGVSVGGRTGILNTYATPPNYDPIGHPLQGVLQLRLWARTAEIKHLFASPWVGVNSVSLSMKLRHTEPGHAAGEFLSHMPPGNATSIPSHLTALFVGLETAHPILRAAQFVLGSLSTMHFGTIRVSRQNWDGVYSGDQIINWSMSGGPSPNYPAPIGTSDSHLLAGSADFGMNPNEEGGITVRGLWTVRKWGGVPTGNQWNHEARARLMYDVMVFDPARGDWALALYWTEWQTVNMPVRQVN